MEKKIPSLDFTKLKRIQRRNSDSEILTHRTSKRKNIDEVIQKHRETCRYIKEIRDKLDMMNALITLDESGVHATMKQIRDQLSNFELCSDKTPRFMSRCDALLGNTQNILSNSKNILDYIKHMDEEAEQHDIITMTLLNDMYKEIVDMKIKIQQLEKSIERMHD